MKYKINVLDQEPHIVTLLNAICNTLPESADDLTDMFGLKPGETTVEVEVKVNGVEVDFVKAFGQGMSSLMAARNEQVQDLAYELITKQPELRRLLESVDEAEASIRAALRDVSAL